MSKKMKKIIPFVMFATLLAGCSTDVEIKDQAHCPHAAEQEGFPFQQRSADDGRKEKEPDGVSEEGRCQQIQRTGCQVRIKKVVRTSRNYPAFLMLIRMNKLVNHCLLYCVRMSIVNRSSLLWHRN